MGVPIIDTTASRGWGVGMVSLAELLEREHEVAPWLDEDRYPANGRMLGFSPPTRVVLGSSTFHVHHAAAVRYREGVAFLHDRGRVRILSERGEVLLSEIEEAMLRAYWPDL